MSTNLTSYRPDGMARGPKYLALKERLQRELADGQVVPGAALAPQREMAASLGVALGTLRRALNELEQEGVLRTVHGKGTFVNTVQERRARKQQNVFALVVPQVRAGFYPALLEGFENGAHEFGCQTMIGNSGNDIAKQGEFILQLIDKNVAGVAMMPTAATPTPQHHPRQLQQHGIPVVYCHRPVPEVAAPCVTWCSREIGRIAGRALVEAGHRRIISLIVHPTVISEGQLAGLREALEEVGASLPESQVHYYRTANPDPAAESVLAAKLKEVLAAEPRPTAIFCAFDGDAELLYVLARHKGIRIPEDLSLITFGGAGGGALSRRLSRVTVDEYQIGASVARLLEEMRSGERPLDSAEEVTLPLTLWPGETIAPAQP